MQTAAQEIVAATEKRGIACSRTAVWRFFDRRNISRRFKSEVQQVSIDGMAE
jgi:hypothetical protein